eukprot:NODE_4062_length_1121_cov_101.272545_g3868_i0.p1 GENE.NODE_4062_length_1121_cov_101.272545_g3868_i0~~NODE_4062_length_1121_cov_101.272545_g3868_i0.p1  ORF type:complete len:269 (+),score=48.50 NODE_4062_length_1121_cov_101.272545_g3868_i0:72-878(+)
MSASESGLRYRGPGGDPNAPLEETREDPPVPISPISNPWGMPMPASTEEFQQQQQAWMEQQQQILALQQCMHQQWLQLQQAQNSPHLGVAGLGNPSITPPNTPMSFQPQMPATPASGAATVPPPNPAVADAPVAPAVAEAAPAVAPVRRALKPVNPKLQELANTLKTAIKFIIFCYFVSQGGGFARFVTYIGGFHMLAAFVVGIAFLYSLIKMIPVEIRVATPVPAEAEGAAPQTAAERGIWQTSKICFRVFFQSILPSWRVEHIRRL